jgi:hypothetical protein
MAARAGSAQHRLHARLVSGHSRHLSQIAKADRPFRDLNAAKQALQNIFRDLRAARHSSAIFLKDRPRVLSLLRQVFQAQGERSLDPSIAKFTRGQCVRTLATSRIRPPYLRGLPTTAPFFEPSPICTIEIEVQKAARPAQRLDYRSRIIFQTFRACPPSEAGSETVSFSASLPFHVMDAQTRRVGRDGPHYRFSRAPRLLH